MVMEGSLRASNQNQNGSVSLATVILGIIERLRANEALDGTKDPGPRIKQIDFSVPYDPGQNQLPVPAPPYPADAEALPYHDARRFLLEGDVQIRLEQQHLVHLPQENIARFELKILLFPD
jgi:hypothetical protein